MELVNSALVYFCGWDQKAKAGRKGPAVKWFSHLFFWLMPYLPSTDVSYLIFMDVPAGGTLLNYYNLSDSVYWERHFITLRKNISGPHRSLAVIKTDSKIIIAAAELKIQVYRAWQVLMGQRRCSIQFQVCCVIPIFHSILNDALLCLITHLEVWGVLAKLLSEDTCGIYGWKMYTTSAVCLINPTPGCIIMIVSADVDSIASCLCWLCVMLAFI